MGVWDHGYVCGLSHKIAWIELVEWVFEVLAWVNTFLTWVKSLTLVRLSINFYVSPSES